MIAELLERAGQPALASVARRKGITWAQQHRKRLLAIADSPELRRLLDDSEPTPPAEPVAVDVVIPFHSADAKYVAECVDGILKQKHAEPIVHIIADGCDFPELPASENVRRYTHDEPPGQGPYRLTNALVAGGWIESEYLAVQDADDLSLPDRLWRQVQLLRLHASEMISSAAENFSDSGDLQDKLDWEPIVTPGRVWRSVPRGRCVNPTRTMTVDLFRRLNGFADFRCSGDFDFDNRAAFSDVEIIHDQTVLGRRRLHSASLSHGIAPMDSPARTRDFEQLYRNLAAVKKSPRRAAEFGALDKAFSLRRITE